MKGQTAEGVEQRGTTVLITLPREKCQAWADACAPFVQSVADPTRLAIALRNVGQSALLRSFGWTYAVERTDSRVDTRAVRLDGFIPDRLKRAAPRRIADYLAGRHCAASAAESAGFGYTAPGIADDGSPLWTSETVGSISHTGKLAMAVVARAADYRSIGIDCEEIVSAGVAEEIRSTVLSTREFHTLSARVCPLDMPTLITTVFSAKESIYKCLRPLADDFFEFHDVQLHYADFSRGLLHFELARSLGRDLPNGMKLESRFSATEGRVDSITVLKRATWSWL